MTQNIQSKNEKLIKIKFQPKYALISLSSDEDRFGFVLKLDVEVEFTKLLGSANDLLWLAAVFLLVVAEELILLNQFDLHGLLGLLLLSPGAGLRPLLILGGVGGLVRQLPP